jgi:hypothetical protein
MLGWDGLLVGVVDSGAMDGWMDGGGTCVGVLAHPFDVAN